jgi:hypothetical protein
MKKNSIKDLKGTKMQIMALDWISKTRMKTIGKMNNLEIIIINDINKETHILFKLRSVYIL